MPLFEIIVRLSALAILSSYLLHKRYERERNCHPKPKGPAQWNGKVFDATPVRPCVERLREDYLAPPRFAAHNASHRKYLLAQARRSLGHLSYFCRDEKTKDEILEDQSPG
ncbi:MAG: hypothetical protein ABIR24_07105 [Verrucomicrobiota bacterium]